ncbi:MAG: hypothetical protein Q9157_003633 [Trypethelium eluteriae]
MSLKVVSRSNLRYRGHMSNSDARQVGVAPLSHLESLANHGQNGFVVLNRLRSFWKNSVARSKTGQFSFWLGHYHVVGLSGEAARKTFLEHRDLERITAAVLHGVGPEVVPPIHPIFRSTPKGHSYFQRRVLDLVTTDHLRKNLSRVTKDARDTFDTLSRSAEEFVDPVQTCYRLVLKQSCRVLCTDEISDTPQYMDSYLSWMKMLQTLSSGHAVCRPWLPSWTLMKRRYGRRGLHNLVAPIVSRRMEKGAPRKDDTLQLLINSGDSQDYIVTYFISILFISVANAGKLAGVLLTMVANHADWQEKIYNEVKEAAAVHATNKDVPIVDQLNSLSLEAWESSFVFLELCFREAIRMHVAFPMTRYNESSKAIPIPGTGEVIPPGSMVAYNTGEAHFNEKLYPVPGKLDPMRFSEGCNEHSKETYAFLGWGNGRHRCVGQRWAKLQHYIVIAYAIAKFKWIACDQNGKPIPSFDRETDFDRHGNKLATGIYLKHIPREKS